MDKIIEFINKQTNNKYKNLLFFGATLIQNNGVMQIEFSRLSKDEKIKQNVDELTLLCKEYLKDYVKDIKLIFHSNSLTMQEFREYIISKIIASEQIKNIDISKINFDFLDEKTVVNIPYQEGSLNEDVLSAVKQNLEDELISQLNQNIQISFEKIKNTDSVLLNRKDRIIEDNYIYEEMKKNQSVQIQDIDVVVGNFNEETACLAGNLSNDNGGEICVVGYVSACLIKELKPKNNDASEEIEEKSQRKYMILELEYDGLKTRGVWFIPKNYENTEVFALQETIAISGKLSEYSGKENITISSIARCKFNPPQKVWRRCPATYQYIKPEPYEFTEQINFFSIDKKTDNKYLLDNTFVVYDLETTGINPDNCKIIDIGAFKIVDGKIVEKFCTFVNPECEIPEEASKVNRITNAMVADCPTIEMVLPDFYKFCYGSIIVGYNNIGFDDLFINKEGKRLFYNFDNKRDDAFNIAKSKIGGLRNYKLSTVCQELEVPLIDAHRAANDALATAKLFIKLVEKYC